MSLLCGTVEEKLFLKKKNNQAIPEKETESKQNEKRPKRKKLRIKGGPLVSSRVSNKSSAKSRKGLKFWGK